MLRVYVRGPDQDQRMEQAATAFEVGRGPQRDLPRVIVTDKYVSRDQLRVEVVGDDRVRVTNLSQSQSVTLPGGAILTAGSGSELALPARIHVGQTQLALEPETSAAPSAGAGQQLGETAFDQKLFLTVTEPARLREGKDRRPLLKALGDAPTPEKVAYWLESIINLQRAPAGSKEFYEQTARALVDLIDLELGMVLLRRRDRWEIVGHHAANDRVSSRYSRTLLDHVVREQRTFYQDADTWKVEAASLANVDAVVVSPIFGLGSDVAGVLYGSRSWGGMGRGKIRALEAQVVQLLAAGVGENLARTEAIRTRASFEQFFSPELVRELEANPALLEGRNQEVTILVSDLRGFTSMSERLGPEVTCRIVRDVMERLTEAISREGGVIVDYAGDGILAMWNAPVPQPDHVARAARAALAMLGELPAINAQWQSAAGGPLAVGIGINTGSAQVGNTGSKKKLKYGPHGLTVNLASRIQDATKKVGAPLLVSGSVHGRLSETFTTRRAATVELKGISEPVDLYELCGVAAEAAPVATS